VTGEDYRFIIADQLREVGVAAPTVILEPAGRHTAPALTLAALLCPDAESDPVLMVMASDHFIIDLPAFRAAVAEGAEQAAGGALVTFGIVPDRPETGYGYLKTGDRVSSAPTARALAAFVEELARRTGCSTRARTARAHRGTVGGLPRRRWSARVSSLG
jgi:mannose-1-phosphate guanylyltransferase / mannose-6-phosphate isomerase